MYTIIKLGPLTIETDSPREIRKIIKKAIAKSGGKILIEERKPEEERKDEND